MGNFDAKWHAYEVGIKNQASWKTLTPRQRAEQMGRYSEGLQYDEIKAAKKKFGSDYGKALAQERLETTRMYEGLFDEIDRHDANQAMYDDLFGLKPARPTFQQGSGGNFSGHYTTVIPENHAEMQKYYDDVFGAVTPGTQYRDELAQHLNGKMKVNVNTNNPELDKLNDWYRKTEVSTAKVAEFEKHLNGNMKVNVNTENAILEGMNDRYRFLEERSNYKHSLENVLDGKMKVDIKPNKELEHLNDYYKSLEEAGKQVNNFDWKKFGKYAGIALGVAAVIGLGIWAYKKIKNKKEEEKLQEQQQQQQQIEETPVENTTVTETETTKPPVAEELTEETVVVPPVVEETTEETVVIPPVVEETTEVDETEEDEKIETSDIVDETETISGKDGDIKIKVDGESYKVKKGDNVWNIAKGILREELGREATNAEIQIRTREIMKDNNLKLEADGYVCIIHPEQELKVA